MEKDYFDDNTLFKNEPENTHPQSEETPILTEEADVSPQDAVIVDYDGSVMPPHQSAYENDHTSASHTAPMGQQVDASYEYGNQNSVPEKHQALSAMQNMPRKKEKHPVTWSMMVACMLIMLLVGSVMGGGIMLLAQNSLFGAVTQTTDDESDKGADANGSRSSGDAESKLKMSSGTLTPDTTEEERIQFCRDTTVYIETVVASTGPFSQESTSSGSGVILSEDGYIVTNNHVVSDAQAISVTLRDGAIYEAELIGYDSRTDLAVVKIDDTELPCATLGKSPDVAVGNRVYAIGNPLGELTSTVTSGIVSGIDRSVEIDGQNMTLLQTDAAINPGNSGGGLFSAETGELIGIVNAKSYGIEIEGLGFAIPVDTVESIVIDLINLGYVTGRPYLGISMQDVVVQDYSLQGSNDIFNYIFGGQNTRTAVLVVFVNENSPAETAGLRTGDYIIKFGDTEISSTSEFKAELSNYNAGDQITLTVQRESETVSITVILGESSNNS